jgi:hypothetical protein
LSSSQSEYLGSLGKYLYRLWWLLNVRIWKKNTILNHFIQLLHLNEINMRFYGAEYNNIEQYCCTLLHKASYWSSSSVVIVLLHKALFYYNFKKFWKFWNLMKFLKVLKFYENFESFEILWNFLTYWLAKSNFCEIKNHIALSCHVISFIDFARECNMLFYCTEIGFC